MRTANQRKLNSENILSTLGLPIPDNIPALEEEEEVTLRTSEEVATRIVILTYVACAAIEPDLRAQIVPFLQQEGLWEKVSALEKEWFCKEELTDNDLTIMLGRGEAIWLLLWASNNVDDLNLPTDEVDLQEIFQRIPSFMQSPGHFIADATIRSKSEILDQCDFIFRLVWIIKEYDSTAINEMTFNHHISFERHFAINWITGIAKDWDH